jgi:hypothetical protein
MYPDWIARVEALRAEVDAHFATLERGSDEWQNAGSAIDSLSDAVAYLHDAQHHAELAAAPPPPDPGCPICRGSGWDARDWYSEPEPCGCPYSEGEP